MAKYKSEMYKGEKVVFDVRSGAHPNYRVGARATHRTSQYLGLGRNKGEAFANFKKSADVIDRAGNWRTIFDKKDLAKIKRNTEYNNHTENLVFIAKKIDSDIKDKIDTVMAVQERKGYVDSTLNTVRHAWYQQLMVELKQKAPAEYDAVYSRL